MKSIGIKGMASQARAVAVGILMVVLCCARDNPLDSKGTNFHPILPQIANVAPVLVNPGNSVITVHQTLRFSLRAQDADGDSLRYSVSQTPQGAHLNGAVFQWTPGRNQYGVYSLTFYVRDSGTPALSDSQVITIIVMKGF